MLIEEQQFAHYLAKAEEDPYSQAIMDIAKVRIKMITDELQSKNTLKMKETTIYHLLGQLFALNEILELPKMAQEHLDSLPEEEEA
jgi:uncharacterized Rmd1/YagE family protein